AEAAARTRADVVASLRARLKQGDKSLVGNSAYRRYLKTPDQQRFTIDEARIAEEARYDGLYVLRTNTRLHPLNAMLRYRDLLVVEQLFRTFLALVLAKELEDRLAAVGLKPEWRELLADLDRLQEVEVEQDGKRFI